MVGMEGCWWGLTGGEDCSWWFWGCEVAEEGEDYFVGGLDVVCALMEVTGALKRGMRHGAYL